MPGPYRRLDVPNVNQHVVTTPVKAKKKAAAAPAASAPAGDYDPSGYTVEEVIAYLEANPDSTTAVLKAEKAGKARVGITSLAD